MDRAQTIEEVIHRLDEIVEDAKKRQSRIGYFAALYREVTKTVKTKVDEGKFFEDGDRMRVFDVKFANRYLDAVDLVFSGEKLTQSWDYAFEVTKEWWPITLHHLLLGINAHINLDLGIAAIETTGEKKLPSLRNDFNLINDLLADLVGDVKSKLATVWPPLAWMNRYLGDVQDSMINFSMSQARDSAWSFAEELSSMDSAHYQAAVGKRDMEVRKFGQVIHNPGASLSMVTKLIRLGERGSISEIISVLEGQAVQWRLEIIAGKPVQNLRYPLDNKSNDSLLNLADEGPRP